MIKMSDMSCIIQMFPVKAQGLYEWKRKSGEQREKLEGAGKLTFKTEKNATNQETQKRLTGSSCSFQKGRHLGNTSALPIETYIINFL